jgi:predicted transcriptional regulator of viral defense system
MQELTAPLFTLDEARRMGLRKDQVYRLLAEGKVERVGRGIFMEPGSIDPSLITLAAATVAQPEATLCLTSALVHHELVDTIPHGSDIALPRGIRHPAGISYAVWHSFDTNIFSIGRTDLQNDVGLQLFIYSPERCIIDVFRMAHREGQDVAITAIKRWLTWPESSPGKLLEMARSFPKAESQSGVILASHLGGVAMSPTVPGNLINCSHF